MYNPEIPEIQTRYDNVGRDALEVGAAAFMGAVIGGYLDTHTRFGRWVNNSPTADAIAAVIKITACIMAVGLFLLYCYFFVTA